MSFASRSPFLVLSACGHDFLDAERVSAGQTFELEDTRSDYGERRIVCYGLLAGRMVVVAYCLRGKARHVFSVLSRVPLPGAKRS